MTVDAILLADLKRDEGLELTAYPDPLSPLAKRAHDLGIAWTAVTEALSGAPWTIGHGHTGPDVHRGLTWTPAEAEAALVADITTHNAVLDRVLPWITKLDPVRRRVLYNMHFNMGWDNPRTPALEGLSGFVAGSLAKCKAGDYAGCAAGFAASLWARQVKTRADRLVRQMRTGVAGI